METTEMINLVQGHGPAIRRIGQRFSAEDGDLAPEDSLLLNAVVGKVKDVRDFQERTIQDWVYLKWTTHDEISIKKVGKLFFFFCVDNRDRENLAALGSACYDGALVIFSLCNAKASYHSLTFLTAPIWVRVEDLPLMYNKPHIARRALSKIGRVLYFDNKSTSPGFKDLLRAKVVIPINNPLVPGFYFDSQNGEPDWVDFRYEGVFVFCAKCGRVGHRRNRCRMPIILAKQHFDIVLHNMTQGREPTHVSQTFTPLFTNKLIGLKRVNRNRTTEVNLVDYSWERDEEGDSPSEVTLSDGNDEEDHDSSSSDDSSDDSEGPQDGNFEKGETSKPAQEKQTQDPPQDGDSQNSSKSRKRKSEIPDQNSNNKKSKSLSKKFAAEEERYGAKKKLSFSTRQSRRVEKWHLHGQSMHRRKKQLLLNHIPYTPSIPTPGIINSTPLHLHYRVKYDNTPKLQEETVPQPVISLAENTNPPAFLWQKILLLDILLRYLQLQIILQLPVNLWQATHPHPPHLYLFIYHLTITQLPRRNKITSFQKMKKQNLFPSQKSPSNKFNHKNSTQSWESSIDTPQEVNIANLFQDTHMEENNRFYFPSDPFSDPFIPFGSLDYLELNNMFSSTNLSKNSSPLSDDSLGPNYPDSPSPNSSLAHKQEEELTHHKTSSVPTDETKPKKSKTLKFEAWDELGKIVQHFISHKKPEQKIEQLNPSAENSNSLSNIIPPSKIVADCPNPPPNSPASTNSFETALTHFKEEDSEESMGLQEDLNSKPQQLINPPKKFKLSDDPYYRHFPRANIKRRRGERERVKKWEPKGFLALHLARGNHAFKEESVPDLNLPPSEESIHLPRAPKRKKIQKNCKGKNTLVFGLGTSDSIDISTSDKEQKISLEKEGAADQEQPKGII